MAPVEQHTFDQLPLTNCPHLRGAYRTGTALLWITPIHTCKGCGTTGPVFDTIADLGHVDWNRKAPRAFRQINGAHSHVYETEAMVVRNDEDLRLVLAVLIAEHGDCHVDAPALVRQMQDAGLRVIEADGTFAECPACEQAWDGDLGEVHVSADFDDVDNAIRWVREHKATGECEVAR